MITTVLHRTVSSLALAIATVVATPPVAPAQAVAPEVSLQVVPAASEGPAGKEFAALVTVANKSAVSLKNIVIGLENDGFAITSSGAPTELPPFGSAVLHARVTPPSDLPVAAISLLFTTKYTWAASAGDMTSMQVATAMWTPRLPFSDQAQGLPGGTAALFNLLLPVIPAFLSYRLFELIRQGEALAIPVFKVDDIPFAFFATVTVSAVLRLLSHRIGVIDYSNPTSFGAVVALSVTFGALAPGVRTLLDVVNTRKWGLSSRDDAASYLRKALLGPSTPPAFVWVTGRVNGRPWAGVSLQQPDGALALGAQLQVSPNAPDDAAREQIWQTLTTEVLRVDGTLLDRRRLIELVASQTLAVGFSGRIQDGGQPSPLYVVSDGLKRFREENAEGRPLVLPTR